MGRLKEKYDSDVAKKLASEFEIKNSMAIPKITKVVVNSGVGDASKKKEVLSATMKDMAQITGQKPSIQAAKVSEAGFNIRAGMPVGLKVTLRGGRMYDFLDRLISVVLPRLRDFRGLSLKSFDKNGNYSLGIPEYSVFPEVNLSSASKARGIEITIVTNTNDLDKSKKLLKLIGMPFEKNRTENKEHSA